MTRTTIEGASNIGERIESMSRPARYAPTSASLTQLFDCDQKGSATHFEKCLNRAAAVSIW